MKQFIHGLPIKRRHVLYDPEQSPIPHIVKIFCIKTIDGKQEYVGDNYEANVDDYPEYALLIEEYIKQNLSDEK